MLIFVAGGIEEELKPTPYVLVQVIRINQDSYKHVR